MNLSMIRGNAGVAGAVAGVTGGLVFGAAMASYGALPTVASIVRADLPVVGFVVHMAIAAVIGAGFGLLVTHQHAQVSETVFWGLIYGWFWWFLGPQTLLPLLLGNPAAWDLRGAQALFPSLMGHLYYGAVDNIRTAHSREPFEGPREVLVGMADAMRMPAPTEGSAA